MKGRDGEQTSSEERQWSGHLFVLKRLDETRIVIPRVSDCLANLPHFHLVSRERPQQINGEICRVTRSEPSLVITAMEDHRHSVVDRLHQLIWIRRENRICSQLLSSRPVLPRFP